MQLELVARLERTGCARCGADTPAWENARMLIPAKAFEYLRVGRPILALTGEGATADLVLHTAAGRVADWTSLPAIASTVATMYREWTVTDSRRSTGADAGRRFERATLTRELVDVLDSLAETPRAQRPRVPCGAREKVT